MQDRRRQRQTALPSEGQSQGEGAGAVAGASRANPGPEAPAAVTVSVGAEIGRADPRLFGSFVEHLGRGVYGGVFDPGHPTATPEGFRDDVLDLVRELGVTVVRYPGGNFVSGYDWRDGIGPAAERPRRLDLAWKSVETNAFGTDEFIAWCRAADVEPMLALNLGLGTVRDALQLLEYANHPSGTALSDERVRNGSPDPHDVRLWCLGNELDGPWQLGARSAEAYGELAAVTASAMRMFDDDLELVAVGSSNAQMSTFGTWEATVLERTIDLVDYLSCHIYFYNDGDLATFLDSSLVLDRFLEQIAATIQHVKAVTRSERDVRISLDEWNVWNYTAYDEQKPDRRFEIAPRILEEEYTLADAVVVGTLLQSILNHADVVSIAAMAQLVNVIGPIRAEPDGAWRQTTFHPFAAVARSAGHTVLRSSAVADAGHAASAQAVVTTVTLSPDGHAIAVYLGHRGTEGSVHVEVDLAGLDAAEITRSELIWHPDPLATNTAADPLRVVPRTLPARLVGDRLVVELPSVSWASIRMVRRSARG
ncbi:alpha-N-arabinofuranosidase [Agromyces allii]|uniref:non-reducing end alpha-L-arabinofuranosidase n=1 Tax=Agromyces allii TaxID=393607 RepID=A0ABP5BAB3_9MICO|nr:alpha-L-arabinofuranosidase C-terminal domain-containing protein [Agromyces allii]